MSAGISNGDVLIAASIFVSAVGATWRIGNRFSAVEQKLDSHLSYHKGYESGERRFVKLRDRELDDKI